METIIVTIDDAAHARQQLAPLSGPLDATRAAPAPVHWVLVACAPRMAQRVSKWVSHSARESWRAKWADKLFVAVSPGLRQHGHRITEVVAKGPLPELLTELQSRHAGARTLDARRPKHDTHDAYGAQAPHAAPDAATPPRPWTLPGTLSGLGMGIGLLFMLGAES